MQRGCTFTRYRLPGPRRSAALVYRVTDDRGRALGYVQPTVSDASVVWRCFAPYVPFPELAGDHPTREAAAGHLAFLLDVREFRYRRVEAAE